MGGPYQSAGTGGAALSNTPGSHFLPGDVVWGFPLSSANLNDPNLDKMKPEAVPDVVREGCSVERVDVGG